LPAHDRDEAWSDPAPVSGAGIEPASHRARAARGRHSWTRNSGEWRQRDRSSDWTGPKHSSGEWPTLHLDAARDSGDVREPELFSSEWPPKRLAEPLWTTQDPAEPSWTTQDVAESSWTSESRWTAQDVAEPSWTSESRWTAQDPAEPPWTAQDWAAADSSPRGEAARRRIDWLDGPDLDVPQPEPAAGTVHAEGAEAATTGWSVSRADRRALTSRSGGGSPGSCGFDFSCTMASRAYKPTVAATGSTELDT